MHGVNNNFLVLQFLLTVTTTRKKNRWPLKLTNTVTLAEILMLHACMKVQKPRARP